jgi:hypothetical protein
MAVLFRWYDRATLYVANGTYNSTTTLGSASLSVASQPFTVALLTSTYTFSASHNVYGDLTNELTTSGGYTAGGAAIGSETYAQSTTVSNFGGATVTWTASGSGIPAFRYAAIYVNATVASIVKPLLAVIDNNGSDVPATTAPNTLSVVWNGTGIWQMAHS